MKSRKTYLIGAAVALAGMLTSNLAPAAPSCFSGTAASGNSTVNLTVGGQSRSYRLHIPSGLPSGQPVPVVLALHMLGNTASGTQSDSGWDATADSNKFVVAYPQGLNNAWNVTGYGANVDDTTFLKAVVDSVSTKVRIAPNRVYITGYSLGGGMSHRMACEEAAYFAAAHPMVFHLTDRIVSNCSPSRPIAVQEFAGSSDNVVPINGGSVTVQNVTNNFLSAQATFEKWASLNGCTGSPTTVLSSGSNTIKQYTSCNGGVKVGLGTLNGGHTYLTDVGINPSANAWSFFSGHTAPAQPADACSGGGGGGGGGGNTDVNVWLEAERGTVGSEWSKITNASSASNSSYVVHFGGSSIFSAPPLSSGSVTLPFSVSSSGTFNLWFRTSIPNSASNSFWIKVDNGSWVAWDNLPNSPTSFGWNKFASQFNLSAGNHTLRVAYREAGALLDKIHLTTTSATPSGVGGAPNN